MTGSLPTHLWSILDLSLLNFFLVQFAKTGEYFHTDKWKNEHYQKIKGRKQAAKIFTSKKPRYLDDGEWSNTRWWVEWEKYPGWKKTVNLELKLNTNPQLERNRPKSVESQGIVENRIKTGEKKNHWSWVALIWIEDPKAIHNSGSWTSKIF